MDRVIRVLRATFLAVRFITPWLIRVARFTSLLVATAFASWWRGVPATVRTIANQWVDNAVIAGFPTRYDYILYYLSAGLAFIIIVLGWIIASYLTVFLLSMIL